MNLFSYHFTHAIQQQQQQVAATRTTNSDTVEPTNIYGYNDNEEEDNSTGFVLKENDICELKLK